MIERRFVKGSDVRATDDANKPSISGYASVFDEQYDAGYFIETIKPGAFSRAIREGQDVRALFNHHPDHLLGRTKSGTLTLREDTKGLFFECSLPDTQTARDVRTSILRGDLSGCSFGFQVTKQTWREVKDDKTGHLVQYRDIEDCDIFDVSTVTYPAYEGTNVGARSQPIQPPGVTALWPEGVPTEVRSHVPALAEIRITDTPDDPGDGERRSTTDPDNDGDDDSDLVKCLEDSATACESFAKVARAAVAKFDNDVLGNVIKEGTAAMALIDDCMEEANEEISGEANSASLTLELAKARTHMAELSLQSVGEWITE